MEFSTLTETVPCFFPPLNLLSELLPASQAAVYVFYEALDFPTGSLADGIDAFVTKHGRFVSMNQEGWPFDLSLRFRGNPNRFRGEGLKLSKELSLEALPAVQEQLLFLSILGEPLYIGKTENIRKRFSCSSRQWLSYGGMKRTVS